MIARPEVTGRRVTADVVNDEDDVNERVDDPPAYSIAEFCDAHRMSVSFYFKMRSLGLGPEENRTLDHVTVSGESAKRWRRKRRQATAQRINAA